MSENSYSHHADKELGVAVIDRFTYYTLQYLETLQASSRATIQDWLGHLATKDLHSHATVGPFV